MLARFPPPPPVGEITIAERDCTLISEPVTGLDGDTTGNTSFAARTAKRSGEFWVSNKIVKSNKLDKSSHFLEQELESNYWKVAWTTWRRRGTWDTLRTLHEISERDGVSSLWLPMRMVNTIVTWADYLDFIATSLSLTQQLTIEDTIAKYCCHPNWNNSSVKAIALHPRLDFITVATVRDELEIRRVSHTDDRWTTLRDRKQVGVSCMEWAPHCDSLLAVGVRGGILIWHVDPTSPAARFVASWVRPESFPGHYPVTSLSWSPWGNLLISACPRSSSLVVWDVPMGVATRVQRGRGKGVAIVSWSPDGCRVFTGGVSAVLRVWETGMWTNECWADFAGRCKCACWGPKGQVLLFALEGDPSLYYISFHGNETGSKTAIKCADLSPHTLVGIDSGGDGNRKVGGAVQDMVWDATGHRLAVTFTADSEGCELVALFRTNIGHFLLDLLPVGFVGGLEGEYPELIQFKKNVDSGAILAVAWSSGRLCFLPLYFKDDLTQSTQQHHAFPVMQPSKPHPPAVELSLARTPLHGRGSLLAPPDDPLSSIKLYSIHT